jgi:hypothetical protein
MVSLKEGHEVQGDNDKQRGDKRDQRMCEMKELGAMSPGYELGWGKKARGRKVRMNTKGKEEDEWEDDEAEAGAHALRSSQSSI